MSKKARQNTIVLLVAILIAFFAVEAFLRVFDPLGLYYFDNLRTLENHEVASPSRGYVVKPGAYAFHDWTGTELPGFTRAVPDSGTGICRLVFVGDSVTWSYGVSDRDTWVNLVAKQLPSVSTRNAAYPGYSSLNVRGTIGDYPDASAIIYFIISNDDMSASASGTTMPGRDDLMIRKLLLYMITRNTPQLLDRPRFERDMAAIAADKRVTMVAVDNAWGEQLVSEGWPVHLIPMYTHFNSYIDGHPNVEGNQQIAASMLPIVQQAVNDKCFRVF